MTIDMKCVVCKHPNRRRMIELAWNDGMSAAQISDEYGGVPAQATIKRHLKEHTDGEAYTRSVEVVPIPPSRERVLALQTLQLDEFERRIELAKLRAHLMNEAHRDDEQWTPVDWSDFYDILGKDAQAAVSSILKAQGLTDKRELKTADLKLGLFEAMVGAGLAPKSLVGDAPKLLSVQNTDAGEGDDD